MEQLHEIRTRLAHVSEEMVKVLPNMGNELDYIYKTLKANEDIVHLLTDEEIGIFLSAQSQSIGIAIATAKPAAKRKAPALTASDF